MTWNAFTIAATLSSTYVQLTFVIVHVLLNNGYRNENKTQCLANP